MCCRPWLRKKLWRWKQAWNQKGKWSSTCVPSGKTWSSRRTWCQSQRRRRKSTSGCSHLQWLNHLSGLVGSYIVCTSIASAQGQARQGTSSWTFSVSLLLWLPSSARFSRLFRTNSSRKQPKWSLRNSLLLASPIRSTSLVSKNQFWKRLEVV